MHWLIPQTARPTNQPLTFKTPPTVASAWVCAILEPLVFLAVFLSLASMEPLIEHALDGTPSPASGWASLSSAWSTPSQRIVSDVDWGLMLLVLALTFPAPDHLFLSRWERWSKCISTTLMLAVVLLLCAWATRGLKLMNIGLWMSWLLLTPLAHEASITTISKLWRRLSQRTPSIRAVVVGTGPMGIRAARALRRLHGGQAYRFMGWIDLSDTPHDGPDTRPHRACKPLRLGGRRALEQLLKAGLVDQIYLTGSMVSAMTSSSRTHDGNGIWKLISDSTVTVRWVPDVLQATILQGQITTLEGMPVIGLLESPYTGIRAAIKRVSDVLVAAVALMLTGPLMLLIALVVRTETPGPALFRQRRLGMNGTVIEVWKFRTMSVMEDGPNIRQAAEHDDRITPIGRFLRRSSLDELPQFINVLQGRMSVVGPRPHALAHNDLYRGQVMAYMIRHKVRPGITGWAQVNGYRGETETVEKMRCRVEHDLFYLQHWSLAFDLQIILRTVGLVFKDGKAW